MIRSRWWIAAAAMAAALLGGSCGIDGGASVGIEGTGIASGFGSVFVNGIEISTDGADFIFNGMRASEDDIRVGDVVSFTGATSNGRVRATRIEFDRFVDGPIEELDIRDGLGTLVALGQTVRIDANTRFINVAVEDLSVGDLIAVSGLLDVDNVLQATSLQRGPEFVPDVTPIDIEGFVTEHDGAAGHFRVADLTIDYREADVRKEAGPLEVGAFVQAAGTQGAASGDPLVAALVETRSRNVGRDGEEAAVEALVSDFRDLGNFRLNGQSVDATGATRVDDTGLPVVDGARVIVRGRIDGDVILADTLALVPRPDTVLTSTVSAVDAAAESLQLAGRNVQVSATTLYLDSSAAADRTFRIDRIAVGDLVTVATFENDAGNLIATRLERLE